MDKHIKFGEKMHGNHNNSATSEETAAVSEEQKAQVDTMVSIMEGFSI